MALFTTPEQLKKLGYQPKPHQSSSTNLLLPPVFSKPERSSPQLPLPKRTKLDEEIENVSPVKRADCVVTPSATREELALRKNLRDRWKLPYAVVDVYEKNHITHFYQWQRDCLDVQLGNNGNLLYSLPTSSGKTLVAEVILLRSVTLQRKKALFILPFVALIHEKAKGLQQFGSRLQFQVEEYCATQGMLPPPPGPQLAVATPEKANSYVNVLFEEERMEELGVVVIDEFHMVGEPGRGATLEVLIAKLLAWGKVQIVAMSATIANLEDLQRWLNADLFRADFRPVPLREHIVLDGPRPQVFGRGPDGCLNKVRELPPKEATTRFPLPLLQEVLPEHSVIIFVPTKKGTSDLAKKLSALPRELLNVGTDGEALATLAQRLRGLDFHNKVLIECVLRGVAFHNASLSNDERKIVEKGFLNRQIKVLCSTSTLSAGINLPAR